MPFLWQYYHSQICVYILHLWCPLGRRRCGVATKSMFPKGNLCFQNAFQRYCSILKETNSVYFVKEPYKDVAIVLKRPDKSGT